MVLVGRDKERLRKAAGEFPDSIAIASDLSESKAPERVAASLKKHGLTVDLLVNNAGFGDRGYLFTADYGKTQGLISTNVSALTLLTRFVLPDMIAKGSGRILNVASTAAFQPGPLMTVYYASKSFVLSFSVGLAVELEGTGVTVTALCPGPTETGFAKGAGTEGTALFRRTMAADQVARIGYQAALRGRRVVVTGLKNKIATFVTSRLMSRAAAAKLARRVQE